MKSQQAKKAAAAGEQLQASLSAKARERGEVLQSIQNLHDRLNAHTAAAALKAGKSSGKAIAAAAVAANSGGGVGGGTGGGGGGGASVSASTASGGGVKSTKIKGETAAEAEARLAAEVRAEAEMRAAQSLAVVRDYMQDYAAIVQEWAALNEQLSALESSRRQGLVTEDEFRQSKLALLGRL